MFDKFTEDYFMEQAREMGQMLGVDTREGSVYMDACTGHIMRVAKFYEDLRMTFDMLADDTCTGAVLEEKARQWQIYRKYAVPAYYCAIFKGVEIANLEGDRFMAGGYYFRLVPYNGGHYLEAEVSGAEVNYLLPGTPLIPVRNTIGLTAAILGELYVAGSDAESDESLRSRYREAVANPSENGNKQQYKKWCSNYDGVGRVIITPLAYGENTVKALIISAEGVTPTAALIEHIQEEIDPGHGGLGEGKAPIGCHFYAVAAIETEIDITFTAELTIGYTADMALQSVKKALAAYLKDIALNTSDDDTMLIQYVKVIGILADTPGIKDFKDLTINGGIENIHIGTDNVGILGEVTINGGV